MSATDIVKNIENGFSKIEENSEDVYLEDCPSWLTKDYMETCLRCHYKDNDLRILKMHAKPALGKGENYGGVLTRIKADYRTTQGVCKRGGFILKTTYEGDDFAQESIKPYDIFNREIEIYETVLPKLNELLKESGAEEQIFAETLMVDRERSALIFEDLNERDYIMADRLKGLDMDIVKIILRKLAKMHACSAVLNEREKGCLEHYDKGMFNRHTEAYAPCFVGLFEACIRRVEQWPGFEDITAKLKSLIPLYMELNKQVFDPLPSHLNVFIHGDVWTNNVLVKFDKQTHKPLDVIIIDFQYSAWSSPAVDLFYFMNTSLKEEMHLHGQEELIHFYYGYLRDILERLNYGGDIPSLHRFQQQMQEKSFYAMHSTLVVQPVQRNNVNDDADFAALMKSDERGVRFKNTCYMNPYVQKMIRQLLPIYDHRGLLDKHQ
uniref:CHK kinase-like domain-containing protein n=1 Tax=Stomoxys calcitrans TaxID=35570 RepID=A0A1I8P3W3_STOCA